MIVIGQERDDINVTIVKNRWITEMLSQNHPYLESKYVWVFDFRNCQSFLPPSVSKFSSL